MFQIIIHWLECYQECYLRIQEGDCLLKSLRFANLKSWWIFFFFYSVVTLFVKVSFPGRSADKESTCNAGELGLIPELGRSPGEGNSYSLQYSGLEGSMDCLVHGVSKNRTRLSDFHFTSLCKSGLLNRDKLFLSSDVSFASQYSLPWAFQVALVVKNKPASARNIRDAGSFLGSARFPGEGHNNPFK